MLKQFLPLLALLLVGNTLWGQQTAIYRDANEAYKRGMDFYWQQLYGKAREEFRRVIAAKPVAEEQPVATQYQEARLYDGLAALRLDRPDAEQLLLQFISEYEPSDIANRAKFEVAGYYFELQDYKKAIEYYEKVKAISLQNETIAEVRFKQAYSYFVTKDFDKAAKTFKQIKEIQNQYYYPSNYYYGIACFFKDNYDEALESFRKVTKSKQYSRVVPYYICQIYFARKQYDEVISYGEPLLEDKALRNRLEIGQLVGQSYFEKGEYAKALPFMEEYVSGTNKVSKEILYQLGLTQMETGNHAAAAKNFEQLASLDDPIAQSAKYNLGNCYVKINDLTSARAAFKDASELKHNKKLADDAFFLYGKVSAELNFDNDAVNTLTKVPANSPHYDEAQEILGDVFINTRDYERALGIIRKLPSLSPKLKESYQRVAYYRGVQQFTDNKIDDAGKLFDESLKNPIDPTITALAHYWNAEVAFKNKDFDGSIKEYNSFLSLEKSATDLPDNSSRGTALYGLGYAYLQKKSYSNSATNFDKSADYFEDNLRNIKDLTVTNGIYPDALVRAGDCFLAQNSYSKSLDNYNKVIKNNYKNVDYALFQKAIILGVQEKDAEKAVVLDKIISDHPESDLKDDAYYELGQSYYRIKKEDLAISNYRSLVANCPRSELYNKALLKLGLIYTNREEWDKALDYNKQVVAHNPDASDRASALREIQAIYTEQGKSDEYLTYMETVSGYHVSDIERDTISFQAAEKPYNAGNYDKAVTSFTKYIQDFPKGSSVLRAYFERAESYLELKKYNEALADYSVVLKKGQSSYSEISAYKAAEISYVQNKNYKEAYGYYLQLDQFASSPEARRFGVLGLMRTTWKLEKKDQVKAQADRLLKLPNANNDDKAEAYYYIGKTSLDAKKYDEARLAFNDVVRLSGDTEIGAEARYLIAFIYYQKRDLAKAEKLAFATNEEIPDHTYWLIKSFILLSDIYSEQGLPHKAKATLESILDSYNEDPELVKEAQTKLDNLKEAEGKKSKLDEGGDGDGELLKMDDGN